MATKKNPLAQANAARKKASKARIAKVEKQLKVLKKQGLFTGDEKKAAKSSRGSRLVKSLSDVVEGKAKALKVDKKTEKEFKEAGGVVRNGRVVVQAMKGERVTFNKKTREIKAYRTAYGNKSVRTVKFAKYFDPKKIPKPKPGVETGYYIQFEKGSTQRFDTWKGLIDYLGTYGQAQSKSEEVRERFAQHWAAHFAIEEITPVRVKTKVN